MGLDGVSRGDQALQEYLSSPDFTVVGYLNRALENHTDTSGKSSDDVVVQQRMQELALQLQLQTQSCHEDIGRIGAELQATLPRCAADVGRVGVGLDGLRQDTTSLLESIVASSSTQENDAEVSTSLETLSTLHALQAHLTQTKSILTAAATWESTLSSIPPLLASQNLGEAVAALAKLEAGERALRGMPMHRTQRQDALSHVRQQVTVLLQPQLQQALSHMQQSRLGPLQQCVVQYTQLGQMETLQRDYVKIRPTAIHKAWFEYQPPAPIRTDPMSASTVDTGAVLSEWLNGWFEQVLSLLTEERRQSTQVFGAEHAPLVVAKVRGRYQTLALKSSRLFCLF
jgi:Golgi complex component 7 (COG7)